MTSTLCKCGNVRRKNQRNCKPCHAAASRKHRKHNPLTADQKLKDNCRSYAGVYLRRGKLVRQPCRVCGSPDSQMHHEDYTKPLVIDWLCRDHHLQLHRRP